MSFQIIFYNNKAENNRLDKSDFLTQVATISGTLREECSIITPSILIELNNETQDLITSINYAYIEKFKRYYFINNITSFRNNLWRIEMSCDVLMSFKEDILNVPCFIGRNEYIYDLKIPDSKCPVESFPQHFINEHESSETFFQRPFAIQAYYMVGIVSSMTDKNVGLVYDSADLTNFLDYYICDTRGLIVLLKSLYDYELDNTAERIVEPSQCISFIKLYPFNVSLNVSLQSVSTINVGGLVVPIKSVSVDYELSKVVSLKPIIKRYGNISIPFHFANSFLDYEPYTKVKIYLPYVGYIDILPSQFNIKELQLSRNIYIYYTIDYVTDKCQAIIYRNENNSDGNYYGLNVIAKYPCSLAIDIPINRENSTYQSIMQTVADKKYDMAQNSVVGGMVKGTISTASKPLQSDNLISGIASGVSSFFSTAVDTAVGLVNSATQYEIDSLMANFVNVSTGMYSGAIAETYTSLKVLSLVSTPKVKDIYYSPEYYHLVGKPFNAVTRLNNLHGYTEVIGVHLENIVNCTSIELTNIEKQLRSGILLYDEGS